MGRLAGRVYSERPLGYHMIRPLPWAGLDTDSAAMGQCPGGNGQGQPCHAAWLVLASWAGTLRVPAPGLGTVSALPAGVLLEAAAATGAS